MKKALVITISFIIIVSILAFYFENNNLSKKQILSTVNKNITLLNNSVNEFDNIGFPLDVYVSTTEKGNISKEEYKDINGLYASGTKDNTIGKSIYEPISNDVINRVMKIKGLYNISVKRTWDKKIEWIEYDCGGKGMGPETTYVGFYYSPTNKPIAINYNNLELKEEKSGWIYQEIDGDNSYYTERITTNWFYYKMHF